MKFRVILSLLFAVGSVSNAHAQVSRTDYLDLDAKTGKRVLPIDYEDNYISLLHDDSRELTISFEAASCDSGRYDLYIEGWNVKRFRVRL